VIFGEKDTLARGGGHGRSRKTGRAGSCAFDLGRDEQPGEMLVRGGLRKCGSCLSPSLVNQLEARYWKMV